MADTNSTQFTALASAVPTFTDTLPSVFFGANGTTPTQTTGGLSPLQLALVSALLSGRPPAFMVNQDYLNEMRKFSDSGIATSTTLTQTITGISLTSIGDDIYLYRLASDCGPDDVGRTEQVYLGTRANLAYGSFAHYGPKVESGTLSDGTNISDGGSSC